MENEKKPEASQFHCCISCLKNEREIHVDNHLSDDITNIYNILVQEEINQLGLASFVFCNYCTKILHKIAEFRKQSLNSIEYLRNQLDFNVVFVKKEINIDVEPEIKPEEVYLEDTSHEEQTQFTDPSSSEEETNFAESLPADVDAAQLEEEIHSDTLLAKKVHVAIAEKNKSPISRKKSKKVTYPLPTPSVQMQRQVKQRSNHNRESSKKVYSCKECDCTYTTSTHLNRHIMKKHQGASECKYCNKIFLDKEEYEKHMHEEESKIRPDPTILCCEHCGHTTTNKNSLKSHIKKYHTPDEPKFVCNECGKSYKLKNELKQHFSVKHLEKRYQCSDCGKKFAFPNDLRRHHREFHTTEGAYVDCKYCGEKFKPPYLRRHVLAVHLKIRKYKCDLCDMSFLHSGDLKKHQHTHTMTKPYNCTMCTTGYYSNKELGKHFESVHGIVYTPADIRRICGKKSYDYLENRPQTQKTIRKKVYSHKNNSSRGSSLRKESILKHCSQCDYSAKQDISIKRHIEANHTLLTCKECGKTFGSKKSLRDHSISHLENIADYLNCKYCSEKLKAGSMPAHVAAIHLNIRKYKCDLCDKTFNTHGNRARHQYTHTKIKPFKCTMCPTGYLRSLDLKKHFKRVHDTVYSSEEIRKICGRFTTAERRQQNLLKQ